MTKPKDPSRPYAQQRSRRAAMAEPVVDRYAEICAEVAKAHKRDISDPWVTMRASVQFAHERSVEELRLGRRIDLAAFNKLTELLKEHAPAPELEWNVTFVSNACGLFKCQHCGQANRVEEGTYTKPRPPERLPVEPEPVAAKAPAAEPEPEPRHPWTKPRAVVVPLHGSGVSPMSVGGGVSYDGSIRRSDPFGALSDPNPYRKDPSR